MEIRQYKSNTVLCSAGKDIDLFAGIVGTSDIEVAFEYTGYLVDRHRLHGEEGERQK